MSLELRKLLKTLIIILLILLILFPVFMISAGVVVAANEENLLKVNLDNQYINSAFANWQPAELDEWDTFMIPSSWNIVSESDNFSFYDADGNLIACGTILGNNDSQYSDRKDFIEFLGEEEIRSISNQYIPEFVAIDYSNFASLLVEYSNNQKVYYYLSLCNNLFQELFIVFLPFSSVDKDGLMEIAQAIVYSYEYPYV